MLFPSHSTSGSPPTSSEVRRQLFKRPATRAVSNPVNLLASIRTIPLCETRSNDDDVDMNNYHESLAISSSPTNFIYEDRQIGSSNGIEDTPTNKVSVHTQETTRTKSFFLGRGRISARHGLDGMIVEDGDSDDDYDFSSTDFDLKRSPNKAFNTIHNTSERDLHYITKAKQEDRLFNPDCLSRPSYKPVTLSDSYTLSDSSTNGSDIILGFHPDPEFLVVETEFSQATLEKKANDEALQQWMEHAYLNEEIRNTEDAQAANRAMLLEIVRNSDDSRWLYETVHESHASA